MGLASCTQRTPSARAGSNMGSRGESSIDSTDNNQYAARRCQVADSSRSEQLESRSTTSARGELELVQTKKAVIVEDGQTVEASDAVDDSLTNGARSMAVGRPGPGRVAMRQWRSTATRGEVAVSNVKWL